jgi:hypothetical protein
LVGVEHKCTCNPETGTIGSVHKAEVLRQALKEFER